MTIEEQYGYSRFFVATSFYMYRIQRRMWRMEYSLYDHIFKEDR